METGYDYGGSTSSATAVTDAQHLSLRRQKSSRLGNVLRKLIGRKSLHGQMSLPALGDQYHVRLSNDTRFRETNEPPLLQQGPTEFITSAIDARDQRALSLPANKVSRTSALGSHSPHARPHGSLHSDDVPAMPLQAPPRRRASMPSIAASTPEPFIEHTIHAVSDPVAELDASTIGYAITSGSLPRRRSRSVEGLRVLAKSQERPASPTPNRRSDDAQYARDKTAEPAIPAEMDPTPAVATLPPQSTRTEKGVSASSQSQSQPIQQPGLEVRESRTGRPGYQSYDFQNVASAFNKQETIPLEERIMVAEVKLMDLEYAISKLQQRSPSPPTTQTATPRAKIPAEHATETPQGRVTSLTAKSAPGSGSTTAGTVSTQPTALSLSTAPGDDPFVITEGRRPPSAETSLHRPADSNRASTETTSERRSTEPRPLSLTSISIDHFTTLVTLLKREQHARIRLEAELADLRRDVWHVLYPPAPHEGGGASADAAINPPAEFPPRSTSISHRPSTTPPQRPPSVRGPRLPPLATTITVAGPSRPTGRSISGGSLYRQRRWDGSRRDAVRVEDAATTATAPLRRMPSTEYVAPRRSDYSSGAYRRSGDTGRGLATSRSTGGFTRYRSGGSSDSDIDDDDDDDGTAGPTSAADSLGSAGEVFATPVEQSRFEIAAGLGLWGRREGEAF